MPNPRVKQTPTAVSALIGDDPEKMLADYGWLPAAFSDREWSAIKKVLSDAIDRGDAPDMAVKQAVARCAPRVYQTRFKDDGVTRMRPRIGGNYTAVDNGDGTFQITDIPIFAKVPAGAKRNADEIGEEWMEGALEQNRMRAEEGHLPPVHIYHSDEEAVKPSYAGKFILKHIGEIQYEGETIPALFADIIDMPADVFEKVRKGFLPYRSVEVHDWAKTEIDSLALMPTDVPFFRMAMTTIGKVIKREKAQNLFKVVNEGPPTPAVNFAALGDRRALILFRFEDKGEPTMRTKPKNKFVTVNKGKVIIDSADLSGDPGGDGSAVGPSSGTNTEDQETVAQGTRPPGKGAGKKTSVDADVDRSLDTMDDTPGGTKRQPGGTDDASAEFVVEGHEAEGGQDQAQVKMDDGTGGGGLDQQILSILQAIAQKLGVGGGGAPTPPPASPAQDLAPVSGMRSDRKVTGANMSNSLKTEVLRAVAPLQARVAQLTARQAAQDRERTVVSMVEAAMNDPERLAGYDVDEELQGTLLRAARQGEAIFNDVVQLIQSRVPAEPPTDEMQFEQTLADSPEGDMVQRFCATHPGPRNAEWVRAQAKTHSDYVAATGSDIKLESWLETNWRSETQGMVQMTAGRR